MAVWNEISNYSFFLKSPKNIQVIESLIVNFLYRGEGEHNESWEKIPVSFDHVKGEIFFKYTIPACGILPGVKLTDVEKELNVNININEIEKSLNNLKIDLDKFQKTCQNVFDKRYITFDHSVFDQFKKPISELENIYEQTIESIYEQSIENSCISNYEKKLIFKLEKNKGKTLYVEELISKEEYEEEDASEFIGFDDIGDLNKSLKNKMIDLAKLLNTVNFIHLIQDYILGERNNVLAKFKIELIYDIVKESFIEVNIPDEKILDPIHEYFDTR